MPGPRLVLISGRDVLGTAGGHPSYVRAHALAALRAGLEPHVVCLARRGGVVETDFGIVHRVGVPHRYLPPTALQPPVLARAVERLLAKTPGPHVVHGFAIWSAAAVLAARGLERRGMPAIALASAYATRAYEVAAMQDGLAVHGPAHRARYRAWLSWVRAIDARVEGWGYANSALVLVNYDSVWQILTDAFGRGLSIRRVPYASEQALRDGAPGRVPARSPAPSELARLRPAEAPLILAVSRHDPRKGIDRLLLALRELATDGIGFRACLVGPGQLLASHRRLAARLGLDDAVAIPGQVPDVGPYFEHADMFVLPSLAEASGSVAVLEALHAGLPVVATACDGLPEDLRDGHEALLVPPGDTAALAGALRRLIAAPALRARLGADGRRLHDERFSAHGFSHALAGVYSELGLPVTSS
ncbi:MAG: glycosyltransferase family 4 protein [Solirubrobacteraceae bacterium]